MLKTTVRNQDDLIIDQVILRGSFIKSRMFYPGFDEWFINKFMPDYKLGNRDIISVRCKTYKTLLGFSLIKYGDDAKICNLSPMVDGVGITQTMLDSTLFFMEGDFTIDVPLNNDTERLRSKLLQLGFNMLDIGISNDLTKQQSFHKHYNLRWI